MKKLVLAVLLATGFSLASFAQDKGTIEFGANIGFNSSSAGTSHGSYDAGYGFNIGASADYFFSDRWSIKIKTIYDQKGWNSIFTDTETNFYDGRLNLDYLTVPLMGSWHFGGKRNWYLSAGPYAGFLLSAKEAVKDVDYKDEFKTTDFGLSVGIGVKIPLTEKLKLSLEYEEQAGLSEIFKTNDTGSRFVGGRSSFNVGLNFLLK